MKIYNTIQSSIQSISEKTPNWIKITSSLILNILILFLVLVGMRNYVFLPFNIDGESMLPTFYNKEVIYVDRLIPRFTGYERGDIVVFIPPTQHGQKKQVEDTGLMCTFEKTKNILLFQGKENPCNTDATYIKRIIGLPGDRVEIKNGHVFVTPKGENTPQQIREDFLLPRNQNKTCVPATKCAKLFTLASEAGKSFPIVPEGHYFVLGDNRTNSSDSRASSWDTPFVPEKDIMGTVRMVYLSPQPIEEQGSAFKNYREALKNIPASFSKVRLISHDDIFLEQ